MLDKKPCICVFYISESFILFIKSIKTLDKNRSQKNERTIDYKSNFVPS